MTSFVEVVLDRIKQLLGIYKAGLTLYLESTHSNTNEQVSRKFTTVLLLLQLCGLDVFQFGITVGGHAVTEQSSAEPV